MEPPSSGTIELEAKKMKRDLEGWREFLIPAYAILMWTRPTDLGILFGAVTAPFLLLWIMDPTILTTIGVIGLIIGAADFFVPVLNKNYAAPWTAANEKKLEKMSRNFAVAKLYGNQYCNVFMSYRTERPAVFYGVILCVLVLLSYLGHKVDNLLLTYIVVLLSALTPGLLNSGYLDAVWKILSPISPNFKKLS